jgi:hypothetical protein
MPREVVEDILDPATQQIHRILRITDADMDCYLVQAKAHDMWTGLATRTTLADAREQVRLQNLHHAELSALARPTVYPKGQSSPWGLVQSRTVYGPGIARVTTATHGGFVLDEAANHGVPAEIRNLDGVYEEDREWAKVAFAYPDLFTTLDKTCARTILIDDYPDAYTTLTGEVLAVADSRTLRERIFLARSASSYVVTSAERDGADRVTVTAVYGGFAVPLHQRAGKTRRFIVPADEYDPRQEFGFIVDPTRHQAVTD